MVEERSVASKMFDIINHVFLAILSITCVLPIIHILMISLSSTSAVSSGFVTFWPVEFTLSSYIYVIKRLEFWTAFQVTIERVIIGGAVNISLVLLTAYPLSRDENSLKFRKFYVWFFFFTMLFNGGLIPTFMVVKKVGLLDNIWSLILPNALSVYNLVLMINFFRQVPKELEEAATIDGAGHWTILLKVFIPVLVPSIATITLFTIVAHWNSWFDGLIYMNFPRNYPLQTYLRVLLTQSANMFDIGDDSELMFLISGRTIKAAQVFIGALPILMVYPFLQRYFVKGMLLGGVKG